VQYKGLFNLRGFLLCFRGVCGFFVLTSFPAREADPVFAKTEDNKKEKPGTISDARALLLRSGLCTGR
jgi:hypothetical protein